MKRSRTVARASGKSSSSRAGPGTVSGGEAIVTRLTDSARRGELVVITGTGVSIGLTDSSIAALSWNGLIRDGFAYGVKKGKITTKQSRAWEAQLSSKDLDDLLSAAEFIGRKLDAPHGDLYARWLENVFKSVQPTNPKMEAAIRAIHVAGIPLCTLNYDPLLEQVTGLPTINLSETNKVTDWIRCKAPAESPGILHIHGSWDAPATCILGIRDYETAVGNDVRDLIQRSLASFSRLLFVGCGDTFADPNFAALIRWLRGKMKTAAPQHYALVSDGEMAARHADPAWHGFVEPVSYGASHSSLPEFLREHFPAPTLAPARKKAGSDKTTASTSGHARLLQDYRAFLLKDCGQMTIEGVRADMDTRSDGLTSSTSSFLSNYCGFRRKSLRMTHSASRSFSSGTRSIKSHGRSEKSSRSRTVWPCWR